jgi:catechol 2,3-dioxygenase-like lactoylglutathione lyase family enzyme
LTAVVIFVRDLARSTDFYGQVLDLQVVLESDDAVMLSAGSGDHLVLRALHGATRVDGAVGVHYVVWTASDAAELERCERALRACDDFVRTWTENDVRVVEGRDPDRSTLLVSYPSGPGFGAARVPPRVFSY